MNKLIKKTYIKANHSFKICALILVLLLLINSIFTIVINVDASKKGISADVNPLFVENQENSTYSLLIITPKEFTKYLLPLVDHKEKHNIKTKLVTLDEIYVQMFWEGRDKQEKIKYFIKTAIEEWEIKYVLLVGGMKGQSGNWYLPARYVNLDDKGGIEQEYISDLYYADIYDSVGNFSSWDTNNNDVFGEWIGDVAEDPDIDLYPDVAVGRLACRNKLEVKFVVNKIINYETKTSGSEWFKKIVVAAGDPFLETDEIEGENGTLFVLENMSGFEPVKLWTSDGTLKRGMDVIKNVNKGCGFLYLGGHGNPTFWGTHPPQNDKWVDIKTRQISLLTNGYKLPICITTGCANNQIDVTLKNLFTNPIYSLNPAVSNWVPRCFGWRLVSNPYGGSVATIGSVGDAYGAKHTSSGLHEEWEGGIGAVILRFFKGYNHSGLDIIGDAWKYAIHEYLDNFSIDWNTSAGDLSTIDAKTVQGWILLGDPSLKIGGYS